MKPKELTPFGVEVKKRLLDMRMTQKEFCEKYDIPANRFSEILYGAAVGKKYREMIAVALGIKIPA